MDPITAGAAGGLRARQEALDMLANNISNAGTAGYKRDAEFYSLFQEAESVEQGNTTAAISMVEKPWTDFAQGTLAPTGSPTDVALSGPGFFAVNGPSGTLYTRNGTFQVAANGNVTTAEGYPVRLVGGAPLRVGPGSFTIAPDGSVQQGGRTLGRLEVVEFAQQSALAKQAGALFRVTDPAVVGTPSVRTEVHQGKLEGSNVSSAESAVRLVSLMRHFEALQRAIVIGGEMNRKAIEEVARVGQ